MNDKIKKSDLLKWLKQQIKTSEQRLEPYYLDKTPLDKAYLEGLRDAFEKVQRRVLE